MSSGDAFEPLRRPRQSGYKKMTPVHPYHAQIHGWFYILWGCLKGGTRTLFGSRIPFFVAGLLEGS